MSLTEIKHFIGLGRLKTVVDGVVRREGAGFVRLFHILTSGLPSTGERNIVEAVPDHEPWHL